MGKADQGIRLDEIEMILEAARQHLGARSIFLAESIGGREIIAGVSGDERLIEGIMPEAGVSRPGDERLFAVGPFVLEGGWVGMPVVLRHGRPYGTLWMLPEEPLPDVHPADARYLRVVAELIAEHLEPQGGRGAGVVSAEERRSIRRLVRGVGLTMLGQPIVRLATGEVRGYESLARFSGSHPDLTPPHWFAAADAAGLGVDLEVTAVRQSLRHLAAIAPGLFVSVNVSPQAAVSRQLAKVLDGVDLDRVVLEITEHARIDSYTALNRALLPLRVRGAMVAIDDAGAGYASLRHILHVQPDFIKLDETWVADVESDIVRRKLISAFVTFATDIGATVVAEAIETENQATVLRELGVECGQGYHLGRPSLLALPVPRKAAKPTDDYSHGI